MKKTALITGASGGIGAKFAEILASEGYDLIMVARNTEKLNSGKDFLQTSYKVKVYTLSLDLSEKNAAKVVYNYVKNNGLNVDILINNAGSGDYGHFVNSNWDRHESMIALNITALAHLTHLFANEMIERGSGKIMNVASTASYFPGPMMANYYATKAYVLSLTEALSVELRNTGVSICALCPGPTKTGFEEAAGAESADIFNDAYTMDAKTVAEYGYAKMLAGKTVIIPGTQNKILVASGRLVPGNIMKYIVYAVQKKRRGKK